MITTTRPFRAFPKSQASQPLPSPEGSFYSAQDDSEPICDKVCRKRKMPHLSQTI